MASRKMRSLSPDSDPMTRRRGNLDEGEDVMMDIDDDDDDEPQQQSLSFERILADLTLNSHDGDDHRISGKFLEHMPDDDHHRQPGSPDDDQHYDEQDTDTSEFSKHQSNASIANAGLSSCYTFYLCSCIAITCMVPVFLIVALSYMHVDPDLRRSYCLEDHALSGTMDMLEDFVKTTVVDQHQAIRQIFDMIREYEATRKPNLVNVAGGTGTGKTMTFSLLQQVIKSVVIIDTRLNAQYVSADRGCETLIRVFDSVVDPLSFKIPEINRTSMDFVVAWPPTELNNSSNTLVASGREADTRTIRFRSMSNDGVWNCVRSWLLRAGHDHSGKTVQRAFDFVRPYLSFPVDQDGMAFSDSGCKKVDAKLLYYCEHNGCRQAT